MMTEYRKYPKTPRLFGGKVTVTEKLNGSNGAVMFDNDGVISVGSRNRLLGIGKGADNFGFCAWAVENRAALFDVLGPGRHNGEWVGERIQSNPHELDGRMFALFNTDKQGAISLEASAVGLTTVPQLYQGVFKSDTIDMCFDYLEDGSMFSPAQYTEGVILYHHQLNQVFKMTWEHQRGEREYEEGKWKGI